MMKTRKSDAKLETMSITFFGFLTAGIFHPKLCAVIQKFI